MSRPLTYHWNYCNCMVHLTLVVLSYKEFQNLWIDHFTNYHHKLFYQIDRTVCLCHTFYSISIHHHRDLHLDNRIFLYHLSYHFVFSLHTLILGWMFRLLFEHQKLEQEEEDYKNFEVKHFYYLDVEIQAYFGLIQSL